MKVLIIEDSAGMAESICSYLTSEGYQCEMAYNSAQATEKITLHTYDCILLDITLPDGNGLRILEQLKKKNVNDGIIIISAKNSLDDKIEGLKLGADDYLPKPFHLSELNARVAAVIRRRNFQGSNSISFQEITIDVQAQIVTIDNRPLTITRKEYDLLLFLIANKGRVVSKEAIAEHLSGDMADMLDNFGFVYAHMKNLKKKLHDAGCKDYIRTVYGFGYQLES